jgi:hypothetical protein
VDASLGTRWGINGGSPTYIFVDLGARYDIYKVSIQWNKFTNNAQAFIIDITDDTLGTWTTIDSVTNNIFGSTDQTINVFNEHLKDRYVRMWLFRGGKGGFGVFIQEFQVFDLRQQLCLSGFE